MALFSFFKENPEVSADNEGMRKHGLAVMQTVDVAVDRIRNGALSELSEDLLDVGVAHHTLQVGIKEQHFAVSASIYGASGPLSNYCSLLISSRINLASVPACPGTRPNNYRFTMNDRRLWNDQSV